VFKERILFPGQTRCFSSDQLTMWFEKKFERKSPSLATGDSSDVLASLPLNDELIDGSCIVGLYLWPYTSEPRALLSAVR
jgi:hypothetical protein